MQSIEYNAWHMESIQWMKQIVIIWSLHQFLEMKKLKFKEFKQFTQSFTI